MKVTKQISILFCLLPVCLVLLQCPGKSSQNSLESQQALVYLLQNAESNPVKNSCLDFITVESTCISSPDSTIFSCSDSELARIRQEILPEPLQTDEIQIAFFKCWSNCNVTYNTQDARCSDTIKYSNTSVYRQNQKAGTTSHSISWGLCMQQCNEGNSDSENLKDTGATYPGQPF
ncbi:MAG: hypothetical protein AAF518_09380 [Spirochaetota bacterium]